MAELQTAQIVGIPALEGKYMGEMDMWPLEAPEFNRISKFYDNLRAGKWTTTRCTKCGHIAYPPQVICPRCWSDELEWIELPSTARVVSITETLAGAPAGFDCPLIIAWLGFDSTHPLRHLIARIINCAPGEVKPGDTVQFVTFAVPSHPMDVKKETKICDRVYYAF
jgi:uncharacterized OB-fold protein